ncbi:HNH endonuclease [Gordonia phage Kiko]|nr:HNH endonuclease [Gordonia phage Kiko]
MMCSVSKVSVSVPFFQVDDQLPANRKVRQLVETALEGHIEGMAAGFLWTLAGAQCQLVGTDGVVSRADLVRLVLNPDLADLLAGLLVDTGLWHRPGHDCDRCPPIEDGHYLFHDWFAMKYTPADQVRVNRVKRQELKDPALLAQVWARDCLDPADPTIGGCRYCRATVKRKDTRSEKRPHLDHVDPRKAAGIRNVVLACHECNQRKGNRTPQEAGMTLLPPPRPELPTADEDRTGNGGPVSTKRRGDAGPSGSGSSRTILRTSTTDDVEASGFAGHVEVPGFPGPDSPAHGDPGRPQGRRSGTGDDAGTPAGSPRTVEPVAPAPDRRPPADHPPDHSETTLVPPENQAGRAVPRGRGPGQGQGQGLGLGTGELSGHPQPSTSAEPRPVKSRRRRRRSRSRVLPSPPSSEGDLSQSLDAGPPPPGVQAPAGGFGSPWHGWRGPPSSVVETDCPTHHLPEPCWKCGRENEDA